MGLWLIVYTIASLLAIIYSFFVIFMWFWREVIEAARQSHYRKNDEDDS